MAFEKNLFVSSLVIFLFFSILIAKSVFCQVDYSFVKIWKTAGSEIVGMLTLICVK
jgi:hypothetical protein